MMYGGAGDTTECINSVGYTQTCVRMTQCGASLRATAGLMYSGVRAFFSRHISAVLTRTRIRKINGCWRGPRIEVRDEPREGKRETEKNEHALLKSLEWRHAESAIILFGIIYRRAVLTRKSQSSERTIYFFFHIF